MAGLRGYVLGPGERLYKQGSGIALICPYCGRSAELYKVTCGQSETMLWACVPCDARCGAKPKSCAPVGTLAKNNLRQMRVYAHHAMDWLWRQGYIRRAVMYVLISRVLDTPESLAHIGMLDIHGCHKIIKLAAALNTAVRAPDYSASALMSPAVIKVLRKKVELSMTEKRMTTINEIVKK
jgi:hypothetical protein